MLCVGVPADLAERLLDALAINGLDAGAWQEADQGCSEISLYLDTEEDARRAEA